MPESRLRRKKSFQAPETKSNVARPSPRWFAPTMVGLLLIGLAWVVTYYVTQAKYPIPALKDWNLGVGFAILLVGFGFLTRWR